MTWTETKDAFWYILGDIMTDYFNNSKLDYYLTTAYNTVYEKIYEEWVADKKNDKNINLLKAFYTGAPTTSSTYTYPATYKYPASLRLKYTVNGVVYYHEAELDKPGRLFDPNDEASEEAPRYQERNGHLYFVPTSLGTVVTEIDLMYFVLPIPCTLDTLPNASPLLPDYLVREQLIPIAVQIAAGQGREYEQAAFQNTQINA